MILNVKKYVENTMLNGISQRQKENYYDITCAI